MSEDFHGPGYAVEKGLDYMTSEERAKALSKLPNDKTRQQIGLMYTAAKLFPFLGQHANTMLLLYVSDNKATGRESMSKVLMAQMASQRETMRDKLLGFVGRGES